MSNKSNKKMGLFSAMMILVGSVIGSGIFMTPGKVAAAAGSIGPTIIAWVAAGACGILCALVYAELAPMMPKAGGAYVFIREALGDGPAFAYGWSMTFGSFLPVIAMLATAFCTNLAIFFPGLTVTGQRIVGTVIILALMVANLCGVKFGSLIQNIFTVGKRGALALVIFGGLFVLKGGTFLSMTTETVEWGNSLNAAVPALLAFGGYYTLAYMSEEIDNPKRNLPLATIFGMGIVILVNVLLNLSCIGAVGFKELAGADTPVSMAAMTIFGPIGAAIVTLGALISIFGSLNGAIMGPPRVVYAMSKDNMLFGFFSKLHPKFNTPLHHPDHLRRGRDLLPVDRLVHDPAHDGHLRLPSAGVYRRPLADRAAQKEAGCRAPVQDVGLPGHCGAHHPDHRHPGLHGRSHPDPARPAADGHLHPRLSDL